MATHDNKYYMLRLDGILSNAFKSLNSYYNALVKLTPVSTVDYGIAIETLFIGAQEIYLEMIDKCQETVEEYYKRAIAHPEQYDIKEFNKIAHNRNLSDDIFAKTRDVYVDYCNRTGNKVKEDD